MKRLDNLPAAAILALVKPTVEPRVGWIVRKVPAHFS